MRFKEKLINALGGTVKTTNSVDTNAFLKYGARREPLPPDWAQIQMGDEDVYKGYPYAAIQKRANKLTTIARENLTTYVNEETLDYYQKLGQDPVHPYLRSIEDSTDFSLKQFWKTISIYLDLAGAFYLGVVRSKIESKNPLKAPDIYGDVQKFVLLNPYEVKRVMNSQQQVVGYLETKKDGRQREWPAYMIIPMRELNPFHPEDRVWSMTDAAKENVYTLQQSGNYTRETLNGNLNAPGIITTDVILDDEQFANFRARVNEHRKGEPLFGNGAGAIKWETMQTDLDKAALLDINEINRTALFAVSGTSKTALGIEQSGTTRETARVQVEQFISDTVQPRLEDIIDFLNLDYKKYYPREYKATEYWIQIQSVASRDYVTETQATEMRQAQSALAFELMQKGYTMQSSYDYAEGKIELSELELEKGLDKPKNPDPIGGDNPPENNAPTSDVEGSRSDSSSEDDIDTVSEENEQVSNELSNLEGLEPHSELLENGGKGSGNFGHSGREGKVRGSSSKGVKAGTVRHQKYSSGEDDSQQVAEWEETNDPIYPQEIIVKSKDQIGHIISSDSASKAKVAYTIRDKRVLNPFRDLDPNDELDKRDIALYRDYMKATFRIDDKELDRLLDNTKNSLKANSLEEVHDHKTCDCGKVEVLINELGEAEAKTLEESYKKFLNDIEEVQKETYKACLSKLTVNAFDESDIIGKVKKKTLTNKLKEIIQNYWWILTPLFANSVLEDRNKEYGENTKFVFTNALQKKVEDNAVRVSEGHMKTILDDVLSAANKAFTGVMEEKAAELIIEAYKSNSPKYVKYFEEQPSMTEALKAIRNTDILEENRKIYERANELALQGYKRSDIVKKIREEWNHISQNRAELIARNETSRAYSHTQYEADYQFLNSIGQLNTAMKRWVSRRPENERDKICPLCQYLIDLGPIPFTENFLSLGDTLTLDNDGKVFNFACNYENIEGGTAHVSCFCTYELILNGKTLNDATTNGDSSPSNGNNGSNDNSVNGASSKSINANPYHEPAGSSKGGQFAKAPGKAIVERYVSGEGMNLNRELRSGKVEDNLSKLEIDELREALSEPVEYDKPVYRSVDASSIFGELSGIDFEDLERQIIYDDKNDNAESRIRALLGQELTEKGFMSVTKDEQVALGWQDFTGAGNPIVIKFDSPRGLKGIDIEKDTPFEVEDDPQREIILRDGVTYRVDKIGAKEGQIYVEATLIKNGGKGSGNFGHQGRPGKVGGSSSSEKVIANPTTKVTADWLDKHREFAKAKGFTDEWIDESVKDLRRRELKEKGLKAKTTEQFDKIWEEMKKEGQDYSVWYETVGKAHREYLARTEELRAGFDKKEQKQAVNDLEATGVILRNGDKKWLEEQCPAELINGITSGLKEAEGKGLNLKETQVIMSVATRKGGSCTLDPVNNEVKIFLTRDWMNNVEAMRGRAKTKGPDGSKWWTNGKINTNVTHECGHAYIWQIVKNQNLNPYRYERLCEKITSEARDIFARDSGQDYWASRGELSRNEGYKFLSQYGRKNDMECIAESCNNPDYSRFTKIVNDLVMKGIKGEKTWQI